MYDRSAMVGGRVRGGSIPPPLPFHCICKAARPPHPCNLHEVAFGYFLSPTCNLKVCMGVPLTLTPCSLLRRQRLIIRAGAMPRVEV